MRKFASITQVESSGPHSLRVWFDDGAHGSWQPEIMNRTGPMALPLHDPDFFARVYIEDGALVWPNGWDASADYVREEMRRTGTLTQGMAAAE
jgi:Protein of unknown function (DUF2442)